MVGFQRRKTLRDHMKICLNNRFQKLVMPQAENYELSFNALLKMHEHAFCGFADFECLTKKVPTSIPSTSKSFTAETEIHIPISYALIVVDKESNIVFQKYYCGEDVVKHFLNVLKKVSFCVLEKLRENLPLIRETINYNKSKQCHICKKRFKENDLKILEHCHYTGQFRGFSHQSCNLNFRNSYFLPVVIHNLSGYDSHIILKNISSQTAKEIKIVPINMEKYSTFTIDCIKFIDSFRFLSTSLCNLVDNLNKNKYNFPIFNEFFKGYKNRYLLRQKGIFPYSYFSSETVLYETKLPSKRFFYNNLTECNITEDEYEHAQLVWQAFNCKTFADYLRLYQYTDTLLLADVFNNFRRLSLNYYQLDPVHFFTAPDLSWNAGLKKTEIKLQLFTDIDMYLFIESGIRGGISFAGTRFVKANNPYIPESFDEAKPTSYILAIDGINLYGCVMSEYLPYRDFRWLDKKDIADFDITNVQNDSETGYILEVDLLYPQEIHDLHDDFPLAPEHITVQKEMLSKYQKTVLHSLNLKFQKGVKTLIPNLFNKSNYIVHYRNLKYNTT